MFKSNKTRVRYKKDTVDGKQDHVTTQVIVCLRLFCYGYYRPEDHKWWVYDIATESNVAEGTGKDEEDAKRSIRKFFDNHGAVFNDEMRNNTKLDDKAIDKLLKQKDDV